MMNVLFVCSANRLRSPTAEQVFSAWPGVETDSAGISSGADVLLSSEQVDWADVIFVMEKTHRSKLARRKPDHSSVAGDTGLKGRVKLSLRSCEPLAHGAVRLRYAVTPGEGA
jgi:protein-tyrosine-phosphatase